MEVRGKERVIPGGSGWEGTRQHEGLSGGAGSALDVNPLAGTVVTYV